DFHVTGAQTCALPICCTCEARVVIRLPVSRRTTRAADQDPERGQRSENARAAEGGRWESGICLCSYGGSLFAFVWAENGAAERCVSTIQGTRTLGRDAMRNARSHWDIYGRLLTVKR